MSKTTSRKCTVRELNGISARAFGEILGGIFEHSPWIAETAFGQRPFGCREDVLAAMVTVLQSSPMDRQLAVIRAHPDLAGRSNSHFRI